MPRDRSLSPDKPFAWTAKTEQAALLVAEDRLTNERIAAEVGVGRRTLDAWKTNNEFAARVDEHVAAFAETVKRFGIGRVESRVRRLDRDWRRLTQVIEARIAEALAVESARAEHAAKARALGASERQIAEQLEDFPEVAPGMETGLVVRVETPGRFGPAVEHKVDTATLGELRALEMQAAKELGQWTEKKDVDVNVRGLSDADLIARVKAAIGGVCAEGPEPGAAAPGVVPAAPPDA